MVHSVVMNISMLQRYRDEINIFRNMAQKHLNRGLFAVRVDAQLRYHPFRRSKPTHQVVIPKQSRPNGPGSPRTHSSLIGAIATSWALVLAPSEDWLSTSIAKGSATGDIVMPWYEIELGKQDKGKRRFVSQWAATSEYTVIKALCERKRYMDRWAILSARNGAIVDRGVKK